MRKTFFLCFLLLLMGSVVFAAGSTDSLSSGDSWPTDTVKIYVPASAGSNMDIKARLVSKYLTPILGKAVVIENRAGAGGITAATQYLSEEPNSNSMQYFSISHLAVAPLYNYVEYSTDDFVTVVGFDGVENGLFVDSRLGIDSLDELKEWGRDKIVKFASAGFGNDSFLLSQVLMKEMGLQSDGVNSNSFPEAILNVISGNASICYSALATAKQYVEDGSLVPLAVYGAEDYTGYAEYGYPVVKTLKNQGYDIEYSTITWFAMPAGTSDEVLAKLRNAMSQVYSDPEFIKELNAAGFYMLEDYSPGYVEEKLSMMVDDVKGFAERI